MTGTRKRPLSDVEVLRAIFDGADTYDAMVLRLGRKDHAVRAVAKRLERRGLPLVRSRSRARRTDCTTASPRSGSECSRGKRDRQDHHRV